MKLTLYSKENKTYKQMVWQKLTSLPDQKLKLYRVKLKKYAIFLEH